MPSTLEFLAFELSSAFMPLQGGFASQRNAANFMEVLGWELPPGGGFPPFPELHTDDLLTKLLAAESAAASIKLQGGDGEASFELGIPYAELTKALGQTLNDLRGMGGMFAAWPSDYLAVTNIQSDFLPRLINYLLVQFLVKHHPKLFGWINLLGFVEAVHHDADRTKFQTEHLRFTLRFDRLSTLLRHPSSLFTTRFGWGTPDFDFEDIFASLVFLLQSWRGRPAWSALSAEDEVRLLGRLVPEADGDPMPRAFVGLITGLGSSDPDIGLSLYGLRPSVAGGSDGGIGISPFVKGTKPEDIRFPLSEYTALAIEGKGDIEQGVALLIRANRSAELKGGILGGGPLQELGRPVAFELSTRPGGDKPFPLIVIPGGSRLEFEELALRTGARPRTGGADFFVEMELRRARFVLSLAEGSGMLTAFLPSNGLGADLDLAIGWAEGRAYLRGSASLQATFSIQRSIGPLELQTVTVGLTPAGDGAIPVEVSATVKAPIGPLTLEIERIGIMAGFDFKGGANGNLGPFEVDLGFRMPTGIGVVIDAGPVRGGGRLSLDPAGGRYSGVLQLKLKAIDLTAFAIFEKKPDAPLSFVAVLGVRLMPGVQLGFGFTLTGVGGLVGLNRRADVDVLRERLASGAAGNTLFCEDPIRNAPTLLGDLQTFFPAMDGGFLVGPTLQIGWMLIVRFDLGIIIEFPGPSRILILGSVRALIGASENQALLYLRMDILGEINFELELLAFDAQVVNSRALGVLKLTGGAAFRLHWGHNPYVVLSIGGFHPRFDPGPLRLPPLPRVSASMDVSLVVADLWVHFEMYLALTANTFQLGAKVEAGMELGPIRAEGAFSFDALMQLSPFYFKADFSAGFHVEVFDVSLTSVDVSGRLSGPGPVVIHASASVRRLLFKASGSATFRLGDDNADKPVPVPSLVKALEPELSNAANLRVDGEDEQVFLKPERAPASGVLVTPKGGLIWEQKRIPLETTVHRLEGVDLGGPHLLHLDPLPGWMTTSVSDWFNPGGFTNLDLNASQTLNNISFQELPSGFRIGGAKDATAPTTEDCTIILNVYKRPDTGKKIPGIGLAYLSRAMKSMLHERATTPAVMAGKPKVAVRPETFTVSHRRGRTLSGGQTPFQAFQISREGPGRLARPDSDQVINL